MKIVMILALVLGGFYILFLLTAPTTIENTTSIGVDDSAEETTILDTADFENKPTLYIGDPNAKATLIEYGDFKCPSCNQFHRQAGAQLRDEYVNDGRLKIEFRNYPFIGPDSGRAARGTFCANDQDVFTQYHDIVYDYMWDNYYAANNLAAEIEDILTIEKLSELMSGVIADQETFRQCIQSDDYNPFIDANILEAADDGISGTPGFTIAGQKISGPQGYTTFKTLVEIDLQ